jgi:hypothetical protein
MASHRPVRGSDRNRYRRIRVSVTRPRSRERPDRYAMTPRITPADRRAYRRRVTGAVRARRVEGRVPRHAANGPGPAAGGCQPGGGDCPSRLPAPRRPRYVATCRHRTGGRQRNRRLTWPPVPRTLARRPDSSIASLQLPAGSVMRAVVRSRAASG